MKFQAFDPVLPTINCSKQLTPAIQRLKFSLSMKAIIVFWNFPTQKLILVSKTSLVSIDLWCCSTMPLFLLLLLPLALLIFVVVWWGSSDNTAHFKRACLHQSLQSCGVAFFYLEPQPACKNFSVTIWNKSSR